MLFDAAITIIFSINIFSRDYFLFAADDTPFSRQIIIFDARR